MFTMKKSRDFFKIIFLNLTEEFAVHLVSCLRWEKPTASCLWPPCQLFTLGKAGCLLFVATMSVIYAGKSRLPLVCGHLVSFLRWEKPPASCLGPSCQLFTLGKADCLLFVATNR
jgi:hypothetical protein